MTSITRYQARSMNQLKDWVNCIPVHNAIDDECCPDFSCCIPELFERDRMKRLKLYAVYLQSVLRKDENENAAI